MSKISRALRGEYSLWTYRNVDHTYSKFDSQMNEEWPY